MAYALADFFLARLVVCQYLLKCIEHNLHCQAQLVQFPITPFLLTFEIKGLRLARNDAQPLGAFQRLFAGLKLSNLLHWAIDVWTFDINRSWSHVAVASDGTTNLVKFAVSKSKTKPAKSAAIQYKKFRTGRGKDDLVY